MPARLAEDSWRWHRGWFQGVLAQLIGRADSSACSHFFFPFTVPLIFVCLRRLGMEICGCFAGTRCSHPIIFCTDYSIQSLEKDSWREKEQERYVSILNHDSLLIHFFSLMFFFSGSRLRFLFLGIALTHILPQSLPLRRNAHSRHVFWTTSLSWNGWRTHALSDGTRSRTCALSLGLMLALMDSCSLHRLMTLFCSWTRLTHGPMLALMVFFSLLRQTCVFFFSFVFGAGVIGRVIEGNR